MEAYTANGHVTERLRVDLEPAEAEAFSEAWEHIRDHVDDDHPIFRGLARIHKARASETPTERRTR